MAWTKSTSKHVADWQVYDLTFSSMRKLAKWGFILGLVWGVLVVKVHGLPGDERSTKPLWSKAESQFVPTGSCISDYTTWNKMPEGSQKASKLVYFKKAYGSLNFHPSCSGTPRHVPPSEAIQSGT